MAWVNEDDELKYAQMQRVQSNFERFLIECRGERQCGSCKNIYRPLLSMGKLECRLHPENLFHGPPLSSTVAERGLGGARSLAYHYPCCGTVHGADSWTNVKYGGWISRAGCCRADHISNMRWRSIGDVETPVFEAVCNRMRVASNRVLFDNEAASLRLHVLPIPVIIGLYNQRHKFLSGVKGPAIVGPPLQTEDEKIQAILGPNAVVIKTASQLLTASAPIIIRSGTIDIQLSLREAYAAMAIRFELPIDFLKNAMTPLDLEMRAQHHRIKMENESTAQNNNLRSLYMDEQEERVANETSARFGFDASGGGHMHTEFYAFAVSSWIEPINRDETRLFLRFNEDDNNNNNGAMDIDSGNKSEPSQRVTDYGAPNDFSPY